MDITNFHRVHLVGIGGCSMSGLAQLFASRGYYVQGSDIHESPFTHSLENHGIKVMIGHAAENVGDCDLVVYSAAINDSNIERVYATEHNIKQLERCDALGELSRGYRDVIGVSGCHGKTTITSMLALINEYSELNSTVHVGGFVDFLGGGVKIGSHDMFITEACEYVESFLSLSPTVIIMNNIDNDHLNYFRDMDHIVNAFEKFVALLPKDGLLIACVDDARVKHIYDMYNGNKISYGMGERESSIYSPGNIHYDDMGCASYDLMKNDECLGRIKLNVIGDFNLVNSIAACVCALHLGAHMPDIVRALDDFRATRRRFEYFGTLNGAKVFHDYAHHPGEINAVLNGAQKYPHDKMYVVFQCNSYSRAKTLYLDHVTCFDCANEVIVPDIYPGREKDDGTVHARDMVRAICASGVYAKYIENFDGISDYLRNKVGKNDIVITLGSGDVYEKTNVLLDKELE